MRIFSACIMAVFVVSAGLSVRPGYAQEDTIPFKGEINEPDVNVRVDSTTGASVICILRKGERVNVIAQAYDWDKIVLPRSAPAYIHKDLVLFAENQNSGKILKDKVNIRLRPDTGAPILGQLGKGDTVDVVRAAGDWVKIAAPPAAAGWVNKSFINRLPADVKAALRVPEAAPVGKLAAVENQPQPVQEHLIVEGLLKRKVMTKLAPYKLISVSGDLFLICGSQPELEKYIGKKVRITGIQRTTYDDPPVIDVQKVEIIT